MQPIKGKLPPPPAPSVPVAKHPASDDMQNKAQTPTEPVKPEAYLSPEEMARQKGQKGLSRALRAAAVKDSLQQQVSTGPQVPPRPTSAKPALPSDAKMDSHTPGTMPSVPA